MTFSAQTVLGGGERVDWCTPAAIARGERSAWGIWSGLGAKLSKVEIGAGLVADSHGLAELALGVEAVEDDAVNCDCEDFDYHFDDAADEGPVLKSANQIVRNSVLEESLASIVFATPSPDILASTVLFALVQDCSSNSPHDNAEDEKSDGKGSVVNCHFLSSAMTASPVSVKDDDAHEQ